MSLPDCVQPTELLANHTSFRIGGPAEFFAEPSTIEELATLLRSARGLGLPIWVLGGGTNSLVPDQGVRGLVVHLGKGFRFVQVLSHEEEPTVQLRCGAAILTQQLVRMAAARGWGGLEAFAGLPGQLGGAVVMNAQSIGQYVQGVTQVLWDGTIRDIPHEQLKFAYRYTALDPGILVEVRLRFPQRPVEESATRIQEAFCYRNTTQELRLPSAGCAFKNPLGLSAGRLIDQAGLKGARIGDAQVSSRHANFIVNLGWATCDDVLSLMEHIQRRVDRLFHIELEPEIRVLGARWTNGHP